MRDTRTIIILIILAVAGTIAIALLFPPVQAANYYVQQGDTVYVGEHVDISGAVGWQDGEGNWKIAYYGRSGSSDDPQYLIKITKKSDLYDFYLDPITFTQRIGPWYQFYGNGSEEKHGNLLAFNVMPERKDTGLIDQGQNATNITLQNPNQTPIELPKQPLLPVRHVSDYLIARGDGFVIPVKGPTNAWIFGAREAVYDYHSVNESINLTKEVINTLSPGKYTLILQTHEANTTQGFYVRYNKDNQVIDWFDPATFQINHYDTAGQTPENILRKLEQIFPTTHDTFMKFNLEVQNPTISIASRDPLYALNQSINVDVVSLNAPSFLDVRGYTNVAPDTIIKVKVDPQFNVTGDTWKDAIVTVAEGTVGGDMREFKAIIPVDKYNMAIGSRHFIGAKAATGDAITTVDFYIYGNPNGSYVPDQPSKYIAGRYGDIELVPTPPPITIEVTREIIVTRTVTIPVTPPDEQVKAQQKIVADEKWHQAYWVMGIAVVSSVILYLVLTYLNRVYRRAKLK